MIENKFLTEEEIFEENINKITKEFEKNKRGTNAKLERVLLEIRKEKNGNGFPFFQEQYNLSKK